MKFLAELLSDYRRLGPDEDLPPSDDPIDIDNFADDLADDQDSGDTDAELEGEMDPENDQELDAIASDTVDEDPNRAGLIRTVKNAHLVYKRKNEDGSFEELWHYNVSSLQDEMEVRKAILAGTDIPVNKTRSPDGSQEYQLWTIGNGELLNITGLQN